jgi:hypothetical protein
MTSHTGKIGVPPRLHAGIRNGRPFSVNAPHGNALFVIPACEVRLKLHPKV